MGMSDEWKVNTPSLLKEVLNNPSTAALAIPLQIFGSLLAKVADRASKLNDPELNLLMCRLALYEKANPYSKNYDKSVFENIQKQVAEINIKDSSKSAI